MNRLALAVALAVAFGTLGGCVGGVKRAGDVQNVNGISDDIWAGTMTESRAVRSEDPNIHSITPGSFATSNIP